jgi:hypothetical protein
MKKYFRIAFLILLGIFVIMQFFRPKKNTSEGVQLNNITKLLPISDSVNRILKKACNDCHTNNTQYPWYAEVMPVGYFLANHVKDGKRHFNFDEFASYSAKRALHKLEEVGEQVEKGEMPMDSYTWLHKDAILTNGEKKLLLQWVKESRDSLSILYKDSVLKK